MADVVEILVFASHDATGYAAATQLAEGTGARLIDRLSNKLDDLLLVAQCHVTEPVVVVARVRGRIVARIPRLVTAVQLRRDLHGIGG